MRVTNRMMSMTSMQDMNSALTRMSKYQRQLSSLKTINKPSDNPIGAGKSMLYRTSIDKIEQYQKNVTDAKSFTSLSDSALSEINNLMTRVKTLTVRGADNSLGINEKKAIAQELLEIQEHILRMSNSNDGSRYFFSGTNTADPAFERELGIIRYKGNQNEITYQLDDYVAEKISSIGSSIFTSDIMGSTVMDPQYRTVALASVPGLYPPVQGGTFTVNGKSIAIDPAADTIYDVVTKINDAGADVHAQITNAGTLQITSLRGGTDFTVKEGTTNLLYAMGMTASINGGQIASATNPLTPASIFNNDAYNLTSPDVQLRRLNAGTGITIPPPINSFNITDSEGNTISVNLSTITATSTLSDIEREINTAVNNAPSGFNIDRIYVEYQDDSIVLRPNTDQITVTEGAGTTAAELGIAGFTGTRGLPVIGNGLNPQLGVPVDKEITEIGDFFDGAGITFPLGTITITDGALPPASLDVDLSALTRHNTIADVENAINETIRRAGNDDSHPQYPTNMQFNHVTLDVDWDMLHIRVPFGQFNLTDSTGTTGAELGLVTGGLTSEHFSTVALDPEMESVRISLILPNAEKLSATVDMSGVTNVQEFLDRINTGAVTDTGTIVEVRAFLNAEGTGFNIYAVENDVALEISNANDLTADRLELSGTSQSRDTAGIFDTLTRLAKFIEEDNVTAVTAGLQWVEESQSKLIDGRTAIGARMNRVSLVEQRHLLSKMENMTMLSDNEDVDMAEAAMNFAMMQQTYQAALQASAKVLPMSLINYL